MNELMEPAVEPVVESVVESEIKPTGRIFNIQRYSIHDGKGIRTIVFFKGCLLRCRWCCNPESQRYDIETMTVNGKAETVGKDVTVAEIMKKVERDMPYYRRSGGGLTLSGGEVLLQHEFAAQLLRAAKEKGIQTAIQSTALTEFGKVEALLPYLDEFLLDVKHMNPAVHKEFTGMRNELALENARKIAGSGQTRLIVRVPVVPGFNAAGSDIAEIAAFAGSLNDVKLNSVKEIHLLPYHRYGEGKYESLGREYLIAGVAPPSDGTMESLKETAERMSNLPCRIGG